VDTIIHLNVFEHLSDDILIVKHLLEKCKQLNIVVPYKGQLVAGSEHINSYDENYFSSIRQYKYKIFTSKGWRY
jgi:hypothetical protein